MISRRTFGLGGLFAAVSAACGGAAAAPSPLLGRAGMVLRDLEPFKLGPINWLDLELRPSPDFEMRIGNRHITELGIRSTEDERQLLGANEILVVEQGPDFDPLDEFDIDPAPVIRELTAAECERIRQGVGV